MPPDKFKVLGASNTGEQPTISRDGAIKFLESAQSISYMPMDESESFWPSDNDEYLEWKRERLKEYFTAFPSWTPFIEKWKNMSTEEKCAHPGYVSSIPDAADFENISSTDDSSPKKIRPIGTGSESVPNKNLVRRVPDHRIATKFTSAYWSNDYRSISSSDTTHLCWETFNDAYECHVRGLPTSQCMNLLGIASTKCASKTVDGWLGHIAKGTFDPAPRVSKLLKKDHGHGHH